MTNLEAIKNIRQVQQAIEWEYPLDWAIALEKAIEALQKEICRGRKMDKPMKDWTLWEVKEHCKATERCEECQFFDEGPCQFFVGSPNGWELTDPPRWTEQEREDARALIRMAMFSGAKVFRTTDESGLVVLNGILSLKPELFPTLKPGETVKLSEIAGCEDDG